MMSHDDSESQSSGSQDQFVVLEMEPTPVEEVHVSVKSRKSSFSPHKSSPTSTASQEDDDLQTRYSF